MPKKRLLVGAALSLIGFFLSAYLTSLFYEIRSGSAAFRSFCNMGQSMNCDSVAASSFAEFFLGIPLSSFTAGWYVAALIFFCLARVPQFYEEAIRLLVVATGIGTGFSLYYFWVLSSVLKTFCIFCLGIDLVNIASLGIALSLKPPSLKTKPIDRGQWQTMVGVLMASVFVVVLAFKGMDKSEDTSLAGEWVNRYHTASVQTVPVDARTPMLGDPSAPITLVEFSDFQCPFCKRGATTLNSVLNRYPGKVRIAFKNYPLDPRCNPKMKGHGHDVACEAARVALCAADQGMFAQVYEALFENQEKLSPGKPMEWAVAKGVDGARLKSCLDSPEVAMRIQETLKEGDALGVEGTPTFFLNGKKMDGGTPLAAWFKILDELTQ